MAVKNEHPDYVRMIERWNRCRDVTDGQDAVHAAGERYLPRLKDQDNDSYKAYVVRTPFYNATWRTISGLNGMIFRKPPKCEVPASVKPLLEDVTMSGVPFQLFTQEVCEEAMKLDRCGVLVDYPQADPDITKADAQKQNLRPMMQLYRAESIINWRTARVNNVQMLSLVVLKEKTPIDVDEFTQKFEDRYRVLDLMNISIAPAYRVRLFKVKEDGKDEQIGGDVYPRMNNQVLDFIPFTFISTTTTTPDVEEPVLIDLVNINLSHYRTCADLEHGAHFTGLPTPVVIGHTMENPTDKLYIGSTSAWILSSPQADAKYLEFAGTGLGTLKELLEHKEKQMAVLGARMLEQQKKAVQTAESETIHRKGEESMLSAAAQSISLGIERALKWFCDWAGADSKGVEYALNKDFYPTPMTSQMLTALVASWQQGAISEQVLFERLQAGEIISQDTTLEEEQARKETTAPTLTGDDGAPTPKLPKEEEKDEKKPGGKTTIKTPRGETYVIERS